MYRLGIQLLSYNKPKYLKQTLDSLIKVIVDRDKLCIVEQSDNLELKNECIDICKTYKNLHVIDLDKNRGQRGATNVVFKSGFFDDCEYVMITDHDNIFHTPLTIYCDKLKKSPDVWIATGYLSPEHDFERKDGHWIRKSTARAGHMVLRQKDFIKMCPINENFGTTDPDYGCAWFAGLDWWLTHWSSPIAPGYQQAEIIAAYPGGVEHIGRESTWQGKYDDEYDLPTLNWFRKASTYSIIKHFKPRHSYLDYKYWYEKKSLDDLKELDDGEHSIPPGITVKDVKTVVKTIPADMIDDIHNVRRIVKNTLGIDLDPISEKDFISPLKKEKSITKEVDLSANMPQFEDDSNIIAFNYLWPAYGFQFLEKSIKSVLPYVKKYILYLNQYSYVGTSCDSKNIAAVNNIIASLNNSKIEVVFNDVKEHPAAVKQDNIKYYITETLKRTKGQCDYIWYLSTDEVYDSHVAEDILSKAKSKEFKTCVITQPLCYIDNPHWCVNPPENFTRPSIIPNIDGVDLNNKDLNSNLTFHHCSFVLTREEVENKFQNWGHRNDVQVDNKGRAFLNKFNHIKTNKFIQNFHPVQPVLYKSMAFTNDVIHKEMFMEWVYHLIKHNPLDTCAKQTILPDVSSKTHFPFTDVERKFIASVLTNFIPKNGRFLEIGSRFGWTSIMANILSDVQFFGIEPDPGLYIKSFENLIKYKSPTNIISGTVKKMVPKFSNDLFDAVFFNIVDNPTALSQSIIETWPKIKDFGVIFGMYDSDNSEMDETIHSLINRAVEVTCPWGTEVFRTYELYYDLLTNISLYKDIEYITNHKLWFARVRKS